MLTYLLPKQLWLRNIICDYNLHQNLSIFKGAIYAALLDHGIDNRRTHGRNLPSKMFFRSLAPFWLCHFLSALPIDNIALLNCRSRYQGFP